MRPPHHGPPTGVDTRVAGDEEYAMADVLVAVLEGPVFDVAELERGARHEWGTVAFTASTGERRQSSTGQLELHHDGRSVRIVALVGGKGLGIEGDDDLVAEVLAWLARCRPVLDGALAVVTDWAAEPLELTPGTAVDELRARRL
ncbi:hypothetical protein [Cellulomonas dongxiuzhuiae]|uniref:hypothetical protein n=1 Tax=Cellulomonas dongxiuzhuiae TaxID=2819979 RepID=UPI001AAF18F4|nr:hypothetical protein [Cellulomonas dongxiuzhuiae]MBO3087936.1 hypothetical protein [Cellulomonas dongxiuzhuiae]